MQNYQVPINFYGFFQRIELSHNKKNTRFLPEFDKYSSLKESIDDFLDLLVFTHPGECKFAYDFGFNFWENEFINISIDTFNNSGEPRKHFEDFLKESIESYIPKLTEVKVEVFLSNDEASIKNLKIKFFVVIVIQGFIKGLQKEPYKKNIVFSVGPVIKK